MRRQQLRRRHQGIAPLQARPAQIATDRQGFESPKLPKRRHPRTSKLQKPRNSRKLTRVVGELKAPRPKKEPLAAGPTGIPERLPPGSGNRPIPGSVAPNRGERRARLTKFRNPQNFESREVPKLRKFRNFACAEYSEIYNLLQGVCEF